MPQSQTIQTLAKSLGACVFWSFIAILLSPFVINPAAWDDSYFSPKWMWLLSWSGVGLAAMIGRGFLGHPLRIPLKPICAVVFAWVIWSAISLIWSRSPSLGAERLLHLIGLAVAFWIGVEVITHRRRLLAIAWLWILIADVTAIWTLGQDALAAWAPEKLTVVSNLPDWRGYLAAGLGNTNHIGDLLALTMLPTLVLYGEGRNRRSLILLGLSLLLQAAALTVCWSVGSSMGLIAGSVIMLALVVWRERGRFFRARPKRWAFLVTIWSAMLAFYMIGHPLNPHRDGLWNQAFGSDRWKEGGSTRLVIWAGGLEMVRQNPWLGVGVGNFTFVYPEMKSKLIEDDPELLRYRGLWTNAAHNELLQAWSELGIVGVFLLLALIALAYRSLFSEISWSNRIEFLTRMTLCGMFTAILVHSMMNFTLQQPVGAISFFILLAIIAAEPELRRTTPRMPPFVLDKGFIRLRLEWRDMRQPLAAGILFQTPRAIGVAISIFLLLLSTGTMMILHRPLESQTEYKLARIAAKLGKSTEEQEGHLVRALQLDPWATGCRSYYSEWLVQQRRPEDALDQIALVRRRLNSPELLQREARALMQLGRTDEASRRMDEFRQRLN